MSKIQFEIVGERHHIDTILAIGNSFVDSRDTEPLYRRSVMLESEGSTIRVTAEGESNAIQFDYTDGDITVNVPGRIYVKAGVLLDALTTLDKKDVVTISWYDDHISISHDNVEKVNLAREVNTSTNIVDLNIGEYDESNGVVINSEELREAFVIASASAQMTVNKALYEGVIAVCEEADENHAVLRFTSFDGRSSVSSAAVRVGLIGDGLDKQLWNIAASNHALNYAIHGESVEVYYDVDDETGNHENIHFIAKDKGGKVIYHIRASRHHANVNDYIIDNLNTRSLLLFKKAIESSNSLNIPRGEFIETMNNARKIGSFNQNQDFTTHVVLSHDSGSLGVENFILSGRSNLANIYSESIDISDNSSDIENFEIVYPWATHASLLTLISDDKNPDTITMLYNYDSKPGNKKSSPHFLVCRKSEIKDYDESSSKLPMQFTFVGVVFPDELRNRKK